MLRHHGANSYKHMLVSDSETESDNKLSTLAVAVAGESRRRNPKGNPKGKRNNGKGKKSLSAVEANEVARPFRSNQTVDRDALVELAKKYQERMKKIPLPTGHVGEVLFANWKGLAQNLKRFYRQPLHYLTYKLCKEWDKSRFGSEDEWQPLNTIMNWRDAEETIWKIETVHRTCTSPIHLAMLWLSDPEYHVIVSEVIPFRSS